MQNYRIRIDKVDNGYYITLDNDNHISKVFATLDEVIGFLQKFFSEK